MSSPKETFKLVLKEGGQSVTKARLRVFEALLDAEPLPMHELARRASDIDRASVYRAVSLFERLGIVQRLQSGWKYKIELTDKFSDHHHHLTCTSCGKTISINESELEHLISKLANEYHFSPSAHQIEIQGLCQVCGLARANR